MENSRYIQQLGTMLVGKCFLLKTQGAATIAGRIVSQMEGSSDFWVELLPLPPNSVSGDNLGYKIISAEVLRNATFFDEDWELNDKGGR
jgi:hypothetical protein